MSNRELVEWQLYYELHPFGAHITEQMIAGVQAAIYNVNRDPKKQKKPFTAEDFLLRVEMPREDAELQSPFSMLKAWALAQPDTQILYAKPDANPIYARPETDRG